MLSAPRQQLFIIQESTQKQLPSKCLCDAFKRTFNQSTRACRRLRQSPVFGSKGGDDHGCQNHYTNGIEDSGISETVLINQFKGYLK